MIREFKYFFWFVKKRGKKKKKKGLFSLFFWCLVCFFCLICCRVKKGKQIKKKKGNKTNKEKEKGKKQNKIKKIKESNKSFVLIGLCETDEFFLKLFFRLKKRSRKILPGFVWLCIYVVFVYELNERGQHFFLSTISLFSINK